MHHSTKKLAIAGAGFQVHVAVFRETVAQQRPELLQIRVQVDGPAPPDHSMCLVIPYYEIADCTSRYVFHFEVIVQMP